MYLRNYFDTLWRIVRSDTGKCLMMVTKTKDKEKTKSCENSFTGGKGVSGSFSVMRIRRKY